MAFVYLFSAATEINETTIIRQLNALAVIMLYILFMDNTVDLGCFFFLIYFKYKICFLPCWKKLHTDKLSDYFCHLHKPSLSLQTLIWLSKCFIGRTKYVEPLIEFYNIHLKWNKKTKIFEKKKTAKN